MGLCEIYREWEESACSVTCGSGIKTASRECLQGDCTEKLVKEVPCERAPCEVYSDWVEGMCSVTCGNGFRVDRRNCLQGVCVEDLSKTVSCEEDPC